ncbi:MAG: DedA family protein [Gemmatimonadetes bacterium]|nr:DedA family protein [Gemmatimonadota bacterium]
MDPVTARLVEALPVYGPWLLLALAFLETCFLTGLVVPAGLATSVATVLALEGSLSFASVVAAAWVGGALGDSMGFWIGRASGGRVLHGDGRLARMVRNRQRTLDRFFGRTPAHSVSLARVVAFVRTVMPIVAGMSELSYRRYLMFDFVGLTACVGLYVGIGTLSEGSWQVLTELLGLGGALTLIVLVVLLWQLGRRWGRRREVG